MVKRSEGQRGIQKDALTIFAVGDVSPRREEPESLLALVAPIFKKEADIRYCNLEETLSERGQLQLDAPGLNIRAHPKNVTALTSAGFDVVAFTANHGLDFGYDAFLDTIDLLRQNNIQVIGSGRNITEARKPAIIERQGTRLAFLAYISALGTGRAAGADKPGMAPMRASTFYESINYQPGNPPKIVTMPDRTDLAALEKDIKQAKSIADVVIVGIHWGVHFLPAVIPLYEWEVGHAIINAGADIVVGSHPHILKGIEVYQGKVIFHSLGNFAFDLFDLPGEGDNMRKYMISRIPLRKPLFPVPYPTYFYLDPDYPTYPFAPDSRKTIVAKCIISEKRIRKVSFLPAMLNKQGQPQIVAQGDKKFEDVLGYVKWTCQEAELGTQFAPEGDEVVIQT